MVGNKRLPVIATDATARVWRVEDVHNLHSWILLIKFFLTYVMYPMCLRVAPHEDSGSCREEAGGTAVRRWPTTAERAPLAGRPLAVTIGNARLRRADRPR